MTRQLTGLILGTIASIFALKMISTIGLGQHHIAIYETAIAIVLVTAYWRGAFVTLGFVQTFLSRKQFSTLRMGLTEMFVLPELPLLLAVAYYTHLGIAGLTSVSEVQIAAAIAGASLVFIGVAFLVWSLLSWTSLFVGHGVLKDQKLVTRGIYGRVRHPVYLAAFLIWFGLSVGTLSFVASIVTIIYVIPAYILYMKSEEQMMIESFGDEYRNYRKAVPMLIPSIRRYRSSDSGRKSP